MDRLLQVLLALLIGVVFTSAMKCNKMILDKTTIGEAGISNDIMEMGRYFVRTTDSKQAGKLIPTLNGASEIKTRGKTFTAILQPSDLKKVKAYNV